MNRKLLLSFAIALTISTAFISNHILAEVTPSSNDPNVVALNNSRAAGCWLQRSNNCKCGHLQTNLGCAPCDDMIPTPPPLPGPPPTDY